MRMQAAGDEHVETLACKAGADASTQALFNAHADD